MIYMTSALRFALATVLVLAPTQLIFDRTYHSKP